MVPSINISSRTLCLCGCSKPAKNGKFLRGHHFRGQALKTREQKLETRRAYQSAHRDEIREVRRKWCESNPELLKAGAARFRAKHNAKIKERQKLYRDSDAGRSYNVAYTNVYYANPVNRMRLLVNGAISRAKKDGRDFDENLRDQLMASPPLNCGCCGLALDYSMRRGNRKLSPSLDRFDNMSGYTKANVVVVCMRCNEVKGTATIDELEQVIAYMRSRT